MAPSENVKKSTKKKIPRLPYQKSVSFDHCEKMDIEPISDQVRQDPTMKPYGSVIHGQNCAGTIHKERFDTPNVANFWSYCKEYPNLSALTNVALSEEQKQQIQQSIKSNITAYSRKGLKEKGEGKRQMSEDVCHVEVDFRSKDPNYCNRQMGTYNSDDKTCDKSYIVKDVYLTQEKVIAHKPPKKRSSESKK